MNKVVENVVEPKKSVWTLFWENLQFVTLIGLIVGQCTVATNFYFGQFVYLFANIVAVVRSFVLKRPIADKVKDSACLGITLGLLCINFFGGFWN